ncbi:hypothetical protein MBLNU13_g01851t3 [Cladosporium sp. NU13]
MPQKCKHDLLEWVESPDLYDENTLFKGPKQYLEYLMPSQPERAESARKRRLSEATFGCSFGKTNEALFATQTINEGVTQQQDQPEQFKQHDHDAITKAVKQVKALTDTTRLTKGLSQIKQLEAANGELVKQHEKQEQQLEEQKQQLEKLKQQQGDAIKNAVDSAFIEKINKAVKQAVAEQQSKEVEKAVAERLSKEVEKAVNYELLEALNEHIAPEVKEALKKAERDATKAMKEIVDTNTLDNEKSRTENKQERDNATKAVAIQQKLRAQLIHKFKTLHKSEMIHNTWKVRFFQKSKAVIAEVKKHAYQAAASAQEADKTLQDAKEKAEAAFDRMQAVIKRQGDRLEQQQDQLKQLSQVSFRAMGPASTPAETPSSHDLMDLESTAYPSPNSSHFCSSTSSTTNNFSTHGDKPRQGLMFNPHGSGHLSDPENIAMRNHSRKGISSEYNNDSDEEPPASNAPSSDYHHFRSSAGQVPSSFGHPRIGNDTDQSYSHRASRNTRFDHSQQHANYFNGAEQSSSHRAVPPSRTHYTPAQERMTYPPRNTPGASRAQANYTQATQQQQQQQQQQQRAIKDSNGYQQSNFRRAASPPRKRARSDDNDVWEDYPVETPSQEQDVRSSKRARFIDDTQQSNSFLDDTYQSHFSHSGSQLSTRGRGGRGRGRGRVGHMPRDRAPSNFTAQPSSSYVASPAHDQGGHSPGPARRNDTAQPPASYSAPPAYNQGGYTRRGPARGNNTAQSCSFEAGLTSQEYDPYAASQAAEANKRIAQFKERIAVPRNLRTLQSQRQSQPQQPQRNGTGTTNRNGRARNGNGPRGFGRNTRAGSSRLEEPASAGARASIEDESKEQMARKSRQYSKMMRRKETLSTAQPRTQQRRTARTSALETQSFREARGISPESFHEGQNTTGPTPAQFAADCVTIVAQSSAPRPSRGNNGPSQNSTKSKGGDLASRITHPSDEDESPGQHPSNCKKGPSKFANLSDGGLMSKSTFPKRI